MTIVATGKLFNTKIPEPGSPQNTHTLIRNGISGEQYDDCIFDGDGIKLDNCSDMIFNNPIIRHARRTSGNHQGFLASGCRGIVLNNPIFWDCTWASLFQNLCQGIQINGGITFECTANHHKAMLDNGSDILVQNHVIRDSCGYYGLEFQPKEVIGPGGVKTRPTDKNKITVLNLAIIRPKMVANQTQNTGGISIPMESGATVLVDGFYFDGRNPTGTKPALGMELSGKLVTVRNSWEIGIHDPLSINLASAEPNIESLRHEQSDELPDRTGKVYSRLNKKSPYPNTGPTFPLVACGGATLVNVPLPGASQPPPSTTPKPLYILMDDHTWKNA